MAFRRRNLDEDQTTPPLGPLIGGRPMKRDRASSIHATGDRVLRHGRRILLHAGLHGAAEWHIADTIPGQPAQTYPEKEVERVVARTPSITITPGHFVRVVAVSNPAGLTEKNISGWSSDGAQGKLVVTAVYNNGADTTVTRTIDFPGSLAQYAQQPAQEGGAWALLRRHRSPLLLPADMNFLANLTAWTDVPVTVTLALAYYGSPRVIDVVVYEEPLALAYDLSAGDWMIPMHAGNAGGNLGQLPGAVPVIKKSASDPGHGAEIVCDAARRQSQEIGPVLLAVTAWNESDQTVAATETVARQVTSTSYVEIWSGDSAAHSESDAGWSLSSGANARRVQESEERVVLRDADNVVPVKCSIYCRLTTAGPTATVRFETEDYSIVEVAVPSGTSWAWREATGHLRCGLGAQDPTVLQVRAKVSSGTFEWRYVQVKFADL